MEKVILFASAALLFVGVAFATADKGKKKKCAKGQTCCSKEASKETASKKACCKDKKETAKM
jgi:hypothetical protein